MLVLYFYANDLDRLHDRIACEPLPCHNLYPCTPTVRLDTRLLTCYYFYYDYICDVMLGGGLYVSG